MCSQLMMAAGTINLAFTGDSNDFDLTYGAAADAAWSTLDVDVAVTGNTNTFVEAIAQTTRFFGL